MSKYNTSQSRFLVYINIIEEIKNNVDQHYMIQLSNLKPYNIDKYIVDSGLIINNKTELKGFIISILLNNILL